MSYGWRVAKRIAIVLVIGLVVGFVINELSFQFVKESNRAPQEIEIVIPAGTAERVEAGRDPIDIPNSMIFVVGDTLVVTNQDVVDHELGPLWIPPGATASMALDEEQNFVFDCSFQPTNYLGLDVREAVTVWTRISGVLFSGIPLSALLALYSFVMWPIRREEDDA